MKINKDWLPTAKNINALPNPIRRYIHDIETNCDPAGMVQENVILKENCKALEMMRKPKVSREKVEQLEDDFRNDYVSLENTIIEAIKLGGGEAEK